MTLVLQCDLRQFFPSVDHTTLRDILARNLASQFWTNVYLNVHKRSSITMGSPP
jgi:hypothetical protein